MWRTHGLDGWSFEDVLPTFKAMENTPDGDDAYHGRSGPLPVRRRSYEELTPPIRAFIDAAVLHGFRRVHDFNGAGRTAWTARRRTGSAHRCVERSIIL
jgi:choline dehydrogenase